MTASATETPSLGRPLSLDDVPGYLLGRGVTTTDRVIDYRFRVADRSRRNANFRVVVGPEPVALVKQGKQEGTSRPTVHVEGQALEAIATLPAFRSYRRFAPALLDYDPENAIVSSELLHPSTTLTKYFLNLGQPHFPAEAAQTVGHILGTFHDATARAHAAGHLGFVPPRKLWHDDLLRARQESAGLRTVVLERAIAAGLRGRKTPAKPESIPVHGDCRFDNLLIAPGTGARGLMNLRLVDYEMMRLDEPAWDLAFYLAEHVRFWLLTTLGRPCGSFQEAAASARFDLSLGHEAIGAFLQAYFQRRRVAPARREDLLDRVADELPYALLQMAMESLQRQQAIPGTTGVYVEMATKLHEAPRAHLAKWFGLPEVSA